MSFLSALGKSAPGAAPTASGTPGLNLTQYGPALQAALDNYNSANAGIGDLASQLQAMVNGTGGPNLANQELLNATQANANNAASAIASERGINPALAARQIQTTTSGLNQAEAGQAAQARLEQQVAGQGLLAQLLQGQANGATGLFNAGSDAQNAQNTGQIQNQQLNQDAYKSDLNAATGLISSALNGGASVLAAKGLNSGGGGGGGKDGNSSPTSNPSSPSTGDSSSGEDTGNFDPFGSDAGDGGSVGDFAHGGDVSGLRKQFLDAYCKAHGGGITAKPDPVRAHELLLAWHAGKEHVENLNDGGEVGGPAPVVKGDNTKNDRTPAIVSGKPVNLSKSERVIPASIADDPEQVKQFIIALNRKRDGKEILSKSPGALLAKRAR